MPLELGTVLAYIAGIVMLFILGRLFLVPVKFLWKLIYNAVIGGVVLLVLNFIGKFIGFSIPFNIVTSLIVGMLGIPGIILLVILKYIFNS